METIHAHNAEELDTIRRRLHDVYFALPDGLPSTGPTTVRLWGLDEHSTRVPIRSWGPFVSFERRKARVALVIDHVVETELIDTAQIGSLNLAKLWFEGDISTVHVEGHIPVELRLRVERLDVRAEITDDVVTAGRTWGLRRRSS